MKGKKTFRFSLVLLFTALVWAVVLVRCRHTGLDVSALDKVCYQRDIAPIFQNSCGTTGCHSSGRGQAGLSFTDYSSVMKSITPFNPQKSKAYQAITGKAFVQLMPPSGPLTENERILIRVWIDQGAENSTCTSSTSTTPGGSSSGLKSGQVCFQRDLQPVLSSSCGTTGCHDQISHKDGYIINNYSTVMGLVRAGSPTTSKLYTSVKNNSMPPSNYAKLTQAVKDSIFNWIKNGATNDVCASACDTTGTVTYQKQISALLSSNCISCHSGSGAQKGILLDSYTNVKMYLGNGRLMAAVKGTSIQMPPGYKLSTCEMRQLELWKGSGATQN